MSYRTRLLTAGLLVVPSSLSAQAALKGVVREDSSNIPVAGLEVVIPALNKSTTTDSGGRYLLGGLDHGPHVVLVRAIGYRPIRLRAYLVINDTLEVDLTIHKAPVELAPLEVTATAIPLGLEGFEERRQDGFGRFIDWTMLRTAEHRRVSDIFHDVPGVSMRYNRRAQPYLVSTRENCPMQIYVDGLMLYKPSSGPSQQTPPLIDQWSVSELDAIEVYRGASETPMRYGGTTGNCGTVLLWTRRH